MGDLSLLLKTARRGTRFWRGPLSLILGLLLGQALAALPPVATSSKLTAQQAERLSALERGWVANAGQWDKKAAFSAPGYFGTTWVSQDGKLLHVTSKQQDCPKPKTPKEDVKPCPSQTWVLSERWVGGKVKAIRGEEKLETKVSFFLGNDPAKHRSGLPSYRYVSLGEVWPGVEVKLKATQKTVEKLFYLHPKADPSKVRIELQGAKALKLSPEGEILIETGLGELKLSKPVAWQEKEGKKLPVQVSYKLLGKQRYGFKVAKADPSLPIVIDPVLQSTYLGGSQGDYAYALAIHPTTGEVYVAGGTYSPNFPYTFGGAQPSWHPGYLYDDDIGTIPLADSFVARLNSTLTQILQATYLGGSGVDSASALVIHPSTGEIYVAGSTNSTDFPRTGGGAQATYGGWEDAFVARLSADLTSLIQSTYLGGNHPDGTSALAISPSGEVYVAGWTDSTNFPHIGGGAQPTFGSYRDGFVARLSATLTSDLQSTYLGGSDWDEAHALAVHPSTGEVYVGGFTASTDFPRTAGGAQAIHGGEWDGFVARLSADLTQNLQSTYLGGRWNDEAHALVIHPSTGEVYVAGETRSTDFPHTACGAQASNGGGADAFVARLNSSLTQNFQSTYLGRGWDDAAHALVIHPSTGEVYVAGTTTATDFPHTAGEAQSIGSDYSSAFVVRLSADLTSNPQSTYLGGSGVNSASALAIHPSTGEVYVAGTTTATDFPHTAGGAQASNAGGSDAFVARLAADLASPEGGCQVPPGLAGEVVYVPLVEVGGKEYSAGLSLVSGRPLLELISLKPAIQITDFCPAATLTGDRVHIPLAVYGGHSYAGELRMFEENGRLLFEVVSARPLD
jgi:hypothetical protein